MTICRTSTSRSRPGSDTCLRFAAATVSGIWLAVSIGAVHAQQSPIVPGNSDAASGPLVFQTPFVTLDQDLLFLRSQYGRRIQMDLEAQRTDLATENSKIGSQLIAEELELTERRKELSAQEFLPLANAFDQKVQKIRSEQEGKSQALQQRLEAERKAFRGLLGPVLADLMRARGALALIDRQAVLLAADEVDITDEAIAAMDAKLGSGLPKIVPSDNESKMPEEQPEPE